MPHNKNHYNRHQADQVVTTKPLKSHTAYYSLASSGKTIKTHNYQSITFIKYLFQEHKPQSSLPTLLPLGAPNISIK
jgi:hypothetical protein